MTDHKRSAAQRLVRFIKSHSGAALDDYFLFRESQHDPVKEREQRILAAIINQQRCFKVTYRQCRAGIQTVLEMRM